MTETQTFYNDIPSNTNLTHKKLRYLICQLYHLEGQWENLPTKTKHQLWRALQNKTLQNLLNDMQDDTPLSTLLNPAGA